MARGERHITGRHDRGPGPLLLYPFQREIADAIGDPTIERVTLQKCVRVGLTTLLAGVVVHHVANDPAPILALLPTDADARDFIVSDLEPIVAATAAVAGKLSADRHDDDSRNTLLGQTSRSTTAISS